MASVAVLLLVFTTYQFRPQSKSTPVEADSRSHLEPNEIDPNRPGQSKSVAERVSASLSDAQLIRVYDDLGEQLHPTLGAIANGQGNDIKKFDWPKSGDFSTFPQDALVMPLILGYSPKTSVDSSKSHLTPLPAVGSIASITLRRPGKVSGQIRSGREYDSNRISLKVIRDFKTEGALFRKAFSWVPRSGERLANGGRFEFEDCPSMPLRLGVFYAGTELLAEVPISLNPGEEISGLLIDLTTSSSSIDGIASGTSALEKSLAVAQRWKRRGVPAGEAEETTINDTGAFYFSDLRPGLWSLGIKDVGEGTTWLNSVKLAKGENRSVSLDLSNFTPWSDVNVKIIDPAGGASPGIKVGITSAVDGVVGTRFVATDSDGIAHFRMRAGPRSHAFCAFSPTAQIFTERLNGSGEFIIQLRAYRTPVDLGRLKESTDQRCYMSEKDYPWSLNRYFVTSRNGQDYIRIPNATNLRVWAWSPYSVSFVSTETYHSSAKDIIIPDNHPALQVTDTASASIPVDSLIHPQLMPLPALQSLGTGTLAVQTWSINGDLWGEYATVKVPPGSYKLVDLSDASTFPERVIEVK